MCLRMCLCDRQTTLLTLKLQNTAYFALFSHSQLIAEQNAKLDAVVAQNNLLLKRRGRRGKGKNRLKSAPQGGHLQETSEVEEEDVDEDEEDAPVEKETAVGREGRRGGRLRTADSDPYRSSARGRYSQENSEEEEVDFSSRAVVDEDESLLSPPRADTASTKRNHLTNLRIAASPRLAASPWFRREPDSLTSKSKMASFSRELEAAREDAPLRSKPQLTARRNKGAREKEAAHEDAPLPPSAQKGTRRSNGVREKMGGEGVEDSLPPPIPLFEVPAKNWLVKSPRRSGVPSPRARLNPRGMLDRVLGF